MWSITFTLMKRSMKMLIPAGIAIIIGTMFVASTFLFGNALDHSLRQQVSASFGDAQYAISQKDNGSSGNATTVEQLRLDRIRAVQGVSGARPDVTAQVEFSASSEGSHTSTAVISMANPGGIMPVQLTSGLWPAQSGETAIPEQLAQRIGAHVGDMVTASVSADVSMTGHSETKNLRLVGITKDSAGAYAYYGGAAIVSEHDFAELQGLGQSGGFADVPLSAAYVSLDPSSSEATARTLAEINRILPDGFHIQNRAAIEKTMMDNLGGGQVNVTTTFILAFGVLAMFVAAIVIANTFQVIVAQRRRTLALLRTIGAKKNQLYVSVIAEAGILGLICSLIGVGCALVLMLLLGLSGIDLAGARFAFVLSWPVFVVPIVFGLVITVLASLGSARAATGVTPLEALQPMEAQSKKRAGRFTRVISALAIVLGMVAMVIPAVNTFRSAHGQMAAMSADASLQTLGLAMLGVMVFFIGVLMCSSSWMPWLLKGIGALVSHIGPASTVASANIQKNPKRVASTGAALLIGVTLVSCLGTGAASAKETMSDALDARYSVDVQVSGSKLGSADVKKVKAVQGVASASLIPTTTATLGEGDERSDMSLYEVSAAQMTQTMRLTSQQQLTHGDLLVPQSFATKDNGLAKGSQVKLSTGNAEDGSKTADSHDAREFTVVAASFRGVASQNSIYGIVAPGTFTASGVHGSSYEIWVKSDGTQAAGTLVDNIKQALSGADGVSVGGSIVVRAQWEQIVNVLLMILVALLAVAVVIALIGVANTLSLSVIERLRESATLRAIGMTRTQLRSSLAMEALLISGCSVIVGLVLGTAFGWLGSYLVFSQFGSVAFPLNWSMDAGIVVIAVVAALLASVLPARRAVSTPPVAALAEA